MTTLDTYLVNVSTIKKTVNVRVGKDLTLEEGRKFVEEYNKKTSAIEGKSFVLNVDCTSMQVFTPEMAAGLVNVFEMYKKAAYSKITFTVQKNLIVKMQLNRIIRSATLSNAEVLEV